MVNMIDRKKLALNMRAFALRKPKFDLTNYHDYSSYMSDYRSYKRDADFTRSYSADRLENILNMCSDEEIINAFKAFSGRLSFDKDMNLSYCAGQYYCVEYQNALKCVIERLLS
jgi:hypothetical protein